MHLKLSLGINNEFKAKFNFNFFQFMKYQNQ
jgi:hypothetical protein